MESPALEPGFFVLRWRGCVELLEA